MSSRLKLKALESQLQNVDGFQKPKIQLEQYVTPPHIASQMLYHAQANYNDLEDKMVADLGCGCGILSIGSALLGAQLTIGFEIDMDAINVFKNNVEEADLSSIECVQANVLNMPLDRWKNVFDTVVMNPPFGTKDNGGIHLVFLEKAIMLSNSGIVYSLHKSSTKAHIGRIIKTWNVNGEVVAKLKYNIDSSYRFHRQKSVDIEVDLWRFDTSAASF